MHRAFCTYYLLALYGAVVMSEYQVSGLVSGKKIAPSMIRFIIFAAMLPLLTSASHLHNILGHVLRRDCLHVAPQRLQWRPGVEKVSRTSSIEVSHC